MLKAGNRHVQPLKRGSADSPSNMQWQTIEAAKIKIFAREVCPGPLRVAKALCPSGGSKRCWEARGEHGIAVYYAILAQPVRGRGRPAIGQFAHLRWHG